MHANELGKAGHTGEFDTSTAKDLTRHVVVRAGLKNPRNITKDNTHVFLFAFVMKFTTGLETLGLAAIKSLVLQQVPAPLRNRGAQEETFLLQAWEML